MGSETRPSACYILSDDSSIPFYSTSNGYKNAFVAQSFVHNCVKKDPGHNTMTFTLITKLV